MNKIFSLMILVAILATALLLASCSQETVVNNIPDVTAPESEQAHTHTFTTKTYKPTCDTEGYTEHTCRCGYYYRDEIKPINPDNHTYYDAQNKEQSSIVTKNYPAKNCSETSYSVKTCTQCGYSSDPIPGNQGAHVWRNTADNNVPDVVIEPTCTTNGKNIYYCQLCGTETSTTLKAVGHLWGEWIVDVEPECSITHIKLGSQHRTCTKCEEIQTEVILPHTSSQAPTVIAPTCTTVGYSIYICDHCGAEYRRDFREKLPHTFTEWCELEANHGFESHTCKGCGYIELRVKEEK